MVTTYRKRILRLKDKPLTPIQKQIFDLIAAGYTKERIARKLRRSVSTVEYHRDNLRVKLGCKTTADLLRYYWTTYRKAVF